MPKKTYPSYRRMSRSLISETIKYIKSGFKTRTRAEQEKLIRICIGTKDTKRCDYYKVYVGLVPRCLECGCCLHIKKRWITAHCPIDRW